MSVYSDSESVEVLTEDEEEDDWWRCLHQIYNRAKSVLKASSPQVAHVGSGPNSAPKELSKGEGCPELISSARTSLAGDVGLAPFVHLRSTHPWAIVAPSRAKAPTPRWAWA